jgi:hypothetical protein
LLMEVFVNCSQSKDGAYFEEMTNDSMKVT